MEREEQDEAAAAVDEAAAAVDEPDGLDPNMLEYNHLVKIKIEFYDPEDHAEFGDVSGLAFARVEYDSVVILQTLLVEPSARRWVFEIVDFLTIQVEEYSVEIVSTRGKILLRFASTEADLGLTGNVAKFIQHLTPRLPHPLDYYSILEHNIRVARSRSSNQPPDAH